MGDIRGEFYHPRFRDTAFHELFANIPSPALVLFGIAPERPALDGRFPWLKCVVFVPLMPVVTAVAIMFGLQVRSQGIARLLPLRRYDRGRAMIGA